VSVVTAAGGRFFCAGWDLKAAAAGEAVDDLSRAHHSTWLPLSYRLLNWTLANFVSRV